jgi:hypothetical protein
MVDVPVPVLVEMDVAADYKDARVYTEVSTVRRSDAGYMNQDREEMGRTDALNAFMGLAPGRGTETMTVMFPMLIFSMLQEQNRPLSICMCRKDDLAHSILPTEMVTFVTLLFEWYG